MVVSGRRPVSKLTLEGAQTACWQWVLRKAVPRAARRSMWGVTATESPNAPIKGLRSSTAMNKTLGGGGVFGDRLETRAHQNGGQRGGGGLPGAG